MKPLDLKAIRERVAASDASPGCSCTPAAGESCELCNPLEYDGRQLLQLVDALTGALLEADAITRFVATGEGGPYGRESLPRTLDAALTAAGFPDQASRDAERKRRTE